jgi:hypothetical protein
MVFFVMAWSPSGASTPESFGLGNPETTPTQFQPPPRRDPRSEHKAIIVTGEFNLNNTSKEDIFVDKAQKL